ncbi:hypothetical protein LSAT2_001824 [Lamellibrachia satsuma]|nr:hypothetical protein LSAT2_001824 [Lamellibrachia satsuma]
MKPKLTQATKPTALQPPVVVQQPPALSGGRGCRQLRPIDAVLLIGLVLSLAVLSVSVIWLLRPHSRGYVQAKCVIIGVQQVQPQECKKLPKCYPGRQAYNDPKTSWCPDPPDKDHGEEENKRQRRSPSHDDYTGGFRGSFGDGPPRPPPGSPDDFPGHFGDGPPHPPSGYPDDFPGHFSDWPSRPPPGYPDDVPGPFGDWPSRPPPGSPDDFPGPFGDGHTRPPHGPHHRPGPGRRHGRRNGRPGNWENHSHEEGDPSTPPPTTPDSGALNQQAKVGSCSLVTVEVFTSNEARSSGKTWTASLYSGRKAAEDCNQCSFSTCPSRPRRSESMACYYRRDSPQNVFGGHLDGRWGGRRIVCSAVFVAIFLVLFVIRRVYIRCVMPSHRVGYTGGFVVAMPSDDEKSSQDTMTTIGLPSDRVTEAYAPPQYSGTVAMGRPPGYDEALALEPKNPLVLTPVAQT